MKTIMNAMLILTLAVGASSCASLTGRSSPSTPEDRLRHRIREETDQKIVAIQYEAESGTAVVQLRDRNADGKERLSYRWYIREGDDWVLSPYVGVKRPDAP